jgi:hypothetical protein
VAARDEHQRPVELVRLGEEERDVHRLRLGHVVVVVPGGIVLVPLPHRAVEGRLRVDLELVHVELFGLQDLRHGFDEARVPGEPLVDRIPCLHVPAGARRGGAFLACDLRAVLREHRRNFRIQNIDLFLAEHVRQEEVAFAVEFLELGGGEPHRFLQQRFAGL